MRMGMRMDMRTKLAAAYGNNTASHTRGGQPGRRHACDRARSALLPMRSYTSTRRVRRAVRAVHAAAAAAAIALLHLGRGSHRRLLPLLLASSMQGIN